MAEIDPRLVRLIARHFDDLKSIQNVPVACALAVGGGAWQLTGSVLAVFVAGLFVFFLAVFPVMFFTDGYEELGHVAVSDRERFIRRWVSVLIVPLLGPQSHLIPGPSVAWLLLTAYFLWLALDGLPWRSYHVLTAAAALYVAFGHVTPQTPSIDYAWMAPRLWVFSAAVIATGIADHLLLVRTLRGRDESLEEVAS